MNEDHLIAVVQRYEELYNFRHPHYSNIQRRDNIWDEIGSIFNQKSTVCKERWFRIRDNYRKATNLRKTKSGQAASRLKAPKFEKELSFLIPFMKDEENRRSNISCSQAEDDNTLDLDVQSPSTPLNESYSPVCSPTHSMESSESNHNKSCPSSIGNSSYHKESVSSVLKNYIERKERQTTASVVDPPSDALVGFFLNMLETVRGLPSDEQLIVKGEVFKSVYEAEKRAQIRKNELSIRYNPFIRKHKS